MSLPRLAVDRPVSTLMLLVSILAVGTISLFRLPLEFYPKLSIPFVAIVVPYPNSNPTQIEKTVARPLEEALATLPDLKTIRSSSDADQCMVQMEFDWGLDLDVLRMLVREKVDQVKPSLPDEVRDIQVYSFNTSDIPVVQSRISAPGVDLSSNYELLESRVLNRLRSVPGVARVTLDGIEPREIFIDLRIDKIKAHRVDVGALIARLRGINSSISLGRISEDGRRYSARAMGSLGSMDEIGQLVIDERGLRLGDIADITYEEPPVAHARLLNREKAIGLNIFKESTANTVATVEAVQRVLGGEIAKDPLLKGINLFVWEDQAREIRAGLEDLSQAGLIGGLLAIGVLFVFLRRWDSTLIVAASVPISLLATTAVMYFSGRNLNVLSMMGLMLGVGMLVDNAIVVLESIDRKHRIEPDTKRSAHLGASEVAVAITASTLTSVIVFLPLVLGGKDDLTIFLGEAGFAIAVSLIASLVVSLLMIPLMAVRIMGRRGTTDTAGGLSWLEDRYASVLGWTFRHKAWTFAIVTVCFVGGFLPFAAGWIETNTFSGSINRRLFLRYEFTDFTYKSGARRVVDQMEDYLWQHKDEFKVRDIYSFYQENRAETTLVLTDESLGDHELKALRKTIREGLPVIPGVKARFENEDESSESTTFFAVKLFGNDLERLNDWAERVAVALEGIDDIEDVTTSARTTRREVRARLDSDHAASLGLDPQDMADIFAFTLGGIRLPRLNMGDREANINLALALEDRENLEDLAALNVGAAEDGRPVQLAEVAEFEVVPQAQSIERENRKIRAHVRAAFEGEGEFGETQEKITEMMDGIGLPPGISWSWNRRIEQQEEQGQQMALNFLLALFLVYVLMASLFESLAQPFAILFAIPFSLIGATWFLTLTGTPFNLMANMGVLILMGIVVNNGIVLLDRVNHYRREGLAREDAAIRAGRDRLRPILMTASTTILGLVPLALGSAGVGGWAYYYPLARTVMGGLMSSTFLTLIVLPYVNIGVESAADWAASIWRASSPRGAQLVGPT